MSSIFDDFATDTAAEEDGKWFGLTPTAEIKLAALSSKRAERAKREVERKYAAQLRVKTGVSQETIKAVALHTIANGCIVDWRGEGWKDDEGNPIPFTPENALMLFERLPKLLTVISTILTDDEAYKAERREEVEGN